MKLNIRNSKTKRRRLGFRPASTLQDALEMATDTVGPQPTITHFHNPPMLMADVT